MSGPLSKEPYLKYLRRYSIPELLDSCLNVYRNDFRRFLGIAALTQLPLGLVEVILGSLLIGGAAPDLSYLLLQRNPLDPSSLLPVGISLLAFRLLSIVVGAFTISATIHLIDSQNSENAEGILRSYKATLFRAPLVAITNILYAIGVGVWLTAPFGLFVASAYMGRGGDQTSIVIALAFSSLGIIVLLALGPVALFLWIRWQFCSQTCLLERRNPFRALRRSGQVVRGNWWRTLWFVILLNVLLTALSFTPYALAAIPIQLISGGGGFVALAASECVSVLARVLLFPIGIIAITLLYYDYRVRTEGLDLELALERLRREEQPA